MKQKLLAFILSFLFIGSINAQESHWSMNSYDYPDARPFIGKVMINGVLQSTTNIEIAAFVGEQVRAVGRLVEIAPDKLPGEFFVWFNIKYNTSGEAVTFKIYDHVSGNEYDNYTATVSGNPVTIVTGMDNPGAPRVPVMLNFVTTQTFEKEIHAYTEGTKDHYYLIASPIGTVSPENVTNMIENSYDLYYFDQKGDNEGKEWINYRGDNGNFDLKPGKGYLYANNNAVTLTFTGTPYNGDGKVRLEKKDCSNASGNFEGWNLVGNPFAQTAYIGNRSFYVMNGDGTEITTSEATSIAPMEGIFVIANTDGEELTFSTTRTARQKQQLVINVTQNRGNAIDRAIVRFDEESTLPKFQLNPSHTKIYIPQGGQDFAVVHSESIGELPINFKAEKNGTYTLNFNSEEVSFSYLHLIDNLTGADVDLLAGASTGSATYTFEAKTTDYASRFRLVFDSINANEAVCGPNFAYFNGSEWMISNPSTSSGVATLQVVDMMGRVLSSETISGSAMVNIKQPAGVYTLRLISDESVGVQKVVVR